MNYSRQRESIMNNLANRYDHPTAETVYLDIQKEYPKISLATVYRNLSQLAELGEIQKITSGIGPDRFDWNPKPHFHFFCTRCGSVTDLKSKDNVPWSDFIQDFDGEIESESVQFYGTCAMCKTMRN